MSPTIDRLERIKLFVQIGASIAIPVIVAIAGWLVQAAVSEAGLRKDYVQMALQVLHAKPDESNKDLRTWAVSLLALHSPVPIPAELKRQLVVSPITLTGRPMGPLEGRINRHGSDLPHSGFQVNIAEECSDLCSKDAKCFAMTFVKHAELHGGICWLKGQVPPATPSEMMTSSVKVQARVPGEPASK